MCVCVCVCGCVVLCLFLFAFCIYLLLLLEFRPFVVGWALTINELTNSTTVGVGFFCCFSVSRRVAELREERMEERGGRDSGSCWFAGERERDRQTDRQTDRRRRRDRQAEEWERNGEGMGEGDGINE